jgi:hypothetical protein
VNGRTEIVRLLLDLPSFPSNLHVTLRYASLRGNLELFRLLHAASVSASVPTLVVSETMNPRI